MPDGESGCGGSIPKRVEKGGSTVSADGTPHFVRETVLMETKGWGTDDPAADCG